MWASDWPFVSHEGSERYDRLLALLFQWLPDAALRRKVLVDTPAALFRFPASAPDGN